jgi:hypothetical protein
VAGKVLFDSQPLAMGDIIIRSQDGKHAAGAAVVDGVYELKATAGPKIVEITAFRDVPGKFREDNPGEKMPVREQYIPAKYNAKTELTVQVAEKDSPETNFELKK